MFNKNIKDKLKANENKEFRYFKPDLCFYRLKEAKLGL